MAVLHKPSIRVGNFTIEVGSLFIIEMIEVLEYQRQVAVLNHQRRDGHIYHKRKAVT